MGRFLAVPLVLLAVAGCSGGLDPADAHPSSDVVGTTTTTGQRPFPASPSASPSSPAPPRASDGSHVEACRDGRCQVAVSAPVTIPVPGPGGRSELSVLDVHGEGIEFRFVSPHGSSEGNTSPGCVVIFTESGGGSSCGTPPADLPSVPGLSPGNGLTLEVLSVNDGTAVLKMSFPGN